MKDTYTLLLGMLNASPVLRTILILGLTSGVVGSVVKAGKHMLSKSNR